MNSSIYSKMCFIVTRHTVNHASIICERFIFAKFARTIISRIWNVVNISITCISYINKMLTRHASGNIKRRESVPGQGNHKINRGEQKTVYSI